MARFRHALRRRLCSRDEAAWAGKPHRFPASSLGNLTALIDTAPPMRGGEYLRADVLDALWWAMERALKVELAESKLPLQDFLKTRDSRWRLVGRVHFNLAENRKDADYPFASWRLIRLRSRRTALRHQPLSQALREYADAGDKGKLLQLLAPVQQASESCSWLKDMVDRGEIFHPLRWTPRDAMRFLSDVEPMERAGLVIRTPAT